MRRTSVRDLEAWTSGLVNPCPAKMSFTPTGSAVNRTGFVALRALAEGPGEGPVTDNFFTANVIHKADVEVKGKGGVVIISIRLTYRGRERAQKKKV